MRLADFEDIHTHVWGRQGSVISLPAQAVLGLTEADEQPYSLQLHPWHVGAGEPLEAFLLAAERVKTDVRCVAIGECGLDACCQTPLPLQHEAFCTALRVAHEQHKPVIVHCVRLWAEMISDVRRVLGVAPPGGYEVPVIIHGYRKGPQLAQQLLDAGFSLSLGQHCQPGVEARIPHGRLYRETDETEISS